MAASPSPTGSGSGPGPSWSAGSRSRTPGSWTGSRPLDLLLLRVHRIPRPVTVRVREEARTDPVWVEVERDLPFEGTPVMADDEFDRAVTEIKTVCLTGERTPVPA